MCSDSETSSDPRSTSTWSASGSGCGGGMAGDQREDLLGVLVHKFLSQLLY